MGKKYYIDTEFIEGLFRPFRFLPTIFGWNKKRWSIQLISIAICCDDGRKYYAVSKEFRSRDANEWVRKNVIAKLPERYTVMPDPNWHTHKYIPGYEGSPIRIPNPIYKSNKDIISDIVQFICPAGTASEYAGGGSIDTGLTNYLKKYPPTFYGYYADYDWVLLCSLFGAMMKLPKGFPMYCVDLKQELDNAIWKHVELGGNSGLYIGDDAPFRNFEKLLKAVKQMPEYPKQADAHNAEDDALFNFNLHNFIIKLQTAKTF